jgi:adenosylhomocysteine nucleosidase
MEKKSGLLNPPTPLYKGGRGIQKNTYLTTTFCVFTSLPFTKRSTYTLGTALMALLTLPLTVSLLRMRPLIFYSYCDDYDLLVVFFEGAKVRKKMVFREKNSNKFIEQKYQNKWYFCSLKINHVMTRNIGILGAMAQEIDEVKALLTEKTVVKIANREFVVGKIGNVRCVVAFSKWGKVAASITATLLIQEFAVTDLIFIGTAGALADGLKVGDIVVSKRLVQHDLDARPIISRFELPLLGRVYVDSDSALTELAGRAVSNLINKGVENMVGEEAVKDFNLNPTLHFGDIASGDQFINSIEKRDEILSLLPDVLCVEMEGAAVAQVCLEFKVPFTVIRTISDSADHNARVDFGKFIVEVANAYSRAIVAEIMRLL